MLKAAVLLVAVVALAVVVAVPPRGGRGAPRGGRGGKPGARGGAKVIVVSISFAPGGHRRAGIRDAATSGS